MQFYGNLIVKLLIILLKMLLCIFKLNINFRKRRENYEEFMSKGALFAYLDDYEKLQLIDSLKSTSYKQGDFIIKEGEIGDTFYILEEGEAFATKTLSIGDTPVKVMDYNVGDYFGELALMKNEPRAANIIAKTDCKCVWIDREAFKRILGPLEELLLRGANKYVGTENK